MSELSKSLHLRSDSTDEAVALLRDAPSAGVVMPAEGGWVTMFPPLDANPYTGDRADLERILAVPRSSLLVLWDFAEDHGLTVDVFEGRSVVAALETMWETRDLRRFDRATFVRLGLLSFRDAADVDAWTKRFTPDYLMAERLGLRHYAWSDAMRAMTAFENDRMPAGTVLVRRDGSVHTATVPEA